MVRTQTKTSADVEVSSSNISRWYYNISALKVNEAWDHKKQITVLPVWTILVSAKSMPTCQ
jgi:hypothetical protein